MIQKNFLYIIGNIISQPFKDLWPRTIRQAIYFIDFYKINSSLKFEITAKRLCAASRRVL